MFVSVPAWQWAWSDHDVRAGHFRRYTRPSVNALLDAAGLSIARSTYAFGGVFPLFLLERAQRRVRPAPRQDQRRLPPVSPRLDRLLMALSRIDARLLGKRDLPFGSSIFVAAVKPGP